METVSYSEFEKVHFRTGTIISAEDFPEARNPAYKLNIDFGKELGIKKSSAQITKNYSKEELIGKTIVAVTNFPPKQIGPFISEVLVCGTEDKNGNITLLSLDHEAEKGKPIY